MKVENSIKMCGIYRRVADLGVEEFLSTNTELINEDHIWKNIEEPARRTLCRVEVSHRGERRIYKFIYKRGIFSRSFVFKMPFFLISADVRKVSKTEPRNDEHQMRTWIRDKTCTVERSMSFKCFKFKEWVPKKGWIVFEFSFEDNFEKLTLVSKTTSTTSMLLPGKTKKCKEFFKKI